MSAAPDDAAPVGRRRATTAAARAQVLPASADAVAAAVLACPLVVALSGGRAGEVATYLPGRRVTGVRVGAGGVDVHVVAPYGPTCEQVAAQVRSAVGAVVGPLPVTVTIDDLDLDHRIITL